MGLHDNEREEGERDTFRIKPIKKGFVPFVLEIDIENMEQLKSFITMFTWDDDIINSLVEYEAEMKERMK